MVGLSKASELAKPGMAVTCMTQSLCSLEHHGVLRRWAVVSLEAAGQASVWGGAKKPSWEWDPHLQWDTVWVCEVTSNSNTNNNNINEQTHLWCFIVSQSKDIPEANSSLLKSPLCCKRCCCWGLGSENFLVASLFVLYYSILLPKCISELLSAAGALVNSFDELLTLQFGEAGICWKPVDVSLFLGRSSCLRFCSYMCGCTTLQHSYWENKGRLGVVLLCFFCALMWNAHYIVN